MSGPARHRKNSRSHAVGLIVFWLRRRSPAVACGATRFRSRRRSSPKLDVSSFQRVLIAGFVAGGNEEVDGNQETVRLLRSQLRSKSSLRVIDADPLPLVEIAQTQSRGPEREPEPAGDAGPGSNGGLASSVPDRTAPQALPAPIKTEKDIEQYERLFANTAYWKQLGEEYQSPLIVTGSVLFMERTSSMMVSRQTERLDAFGRRQIDNQRGLMERRGYLLRPKFVFIDGRSGAHDPHRAAPRGDSLQRRSEHAAPVLVFRADGSARAELPQRPEQPEGPRAPRPAQVALSGPPGWQDSVFGYKLFVLNRCRSCTPSFSRAAVR